MLNGEARQSSFGNGILGKSVGIGHCQHPHAAPEQKDSSNVESADKVSYANHNAGDSRGIGNPVPRLPAGCHQSLAAVRTETGNSGSYLATHHSHPPDRPWCSLKSITLMDLGCELIDKVQTKVTTSHGGQLDTTHFVGPIKRNPASRICSFLLKIAGVENKTLSA